MYDAFKAMLVERAGKLIAGDPKEPRHLHRADDLRKGEATRLKGWIDEAVAAGATLLCGGGLSRGNIAGGDPARRRAG